MARAFKPLAFGGLPSGARSVSAGFTLIEVLVSLLILAVLAATAWKGVDSISNARQIADGNLRQTLRLQAVMTQFEADMAQVMDTIAVQGFQFDGAHLRITRRAPGGMQVVVWYTDQERWMRWASPVTTRVGELQKYWLSSYILQGREAGTLVALKGVPQWQIYCYRGGALSNCQSTGDVSTMRSAVAASGKAGTAAAGAASGAGGSSTAGGGGQAGSGGINPTSFGHEPVPTAVRSILTLGEGSGFSGTLMKDMMLAPQPLNPGS